MKRCRDVFLSVNPTNLDSVATAANVVREAIVLMSVHEERANVGRSIRAENAEAGSLPRFFTNLSDKEQREKAPADLDVTALQTKGR